MIKDSNCFSPSNNMYIMIFSSLQTSLYIKERSESCTQRFFPCKVSSLAIVLFHLWRNLKKCGLFALLLATLRIKDSESRVLETSRFKTRQYVSHSS